MLEIGRMLATASLRRLLNFDYVPPRTRLVHTAIAATTPLLCRPLHLTHVVEFPKCGGSWVRDTLLTYLGQPRNNNQRLLRRNDVLHGHRLHRRSYRWPIVVVRDPRDAYVSLYHHEHSMEEEGTVRRDIHHYFRHDPGRDVRDDFAEYLDVRVTKRMHPWFSFAEFVDSWLDRPRICLVRYEDMLSDPEAQLVRILNFTERPVDRERVRRAVVKHCLLEIILLHLKL